MAWRALRKGGHGVPTLRLFLRGLCLLVVAELIEMCLKFSEVHAVCNAPEVLAAHLRRAKKYNLTGFNMTTGADSGFCEMFSDLFDFGWGVIALCILLYVIRVVHSHVRGVEDARAPVEGPVAGVAVEIEESSRGCQRA